MRELVHINPAYQRPGGVWNEKTKQLFIDSLLNRYDIPKLYFHQITGSKKSKKHGYAIIDGRQRLESIWSFIDGEFPLAEDFEYFDDYAVKAQGMTYRDLAKEYPKLITRLNSRVLTIMVVDVNDLDVVEDMFSRLNEAVPLNAAEKRNAFGGLLPSITRRIVKHDFFKTKINISAKRYRHHDIAAKFLYLEFNQAIVDTKKASLDAFFLDTPKETKKEMQVLESSVNQNLDRMETIFITRDPLLKSSGMTVVYYVLFSRMRRDNIGVDVRRVMLTKFDDYRAENRRRFEDDVPPIDRQLIEFDALAQSSNDGASIRERYEVLCKHLGCM